MGTEAAVRSGTTFGVGLARRVGIFNHTAPPALMAIAPAKISPVATRIVLPPKSVVSGYASEVLAGKRRRQRIAGSNAFQCRTNNDREYEIILNFLSQA
jgi:hypothetical protein